MWRFSFVLASTTRPLRLLRLLHRCSIWRLNSFTNRQLSFSTICTVKIAASISEYWRIHKHFSRIAGNSYELLSSLTTHRQLMWRFPFVIASTAYTVSAVSSTVALIGAFIYHLWTVIFWAYISLLQWLQYFIVSSEFLCHRILFLKNEYFPIILSCFVFDYEHSFEFRDKLFYVSKHLSNNWCQRI